MMLETVTNEPIDSEVLCNYFKYLVNQFFKILPMREKNEESLITYMQSLQLELLGCSELVCAINKDALFMTLVSILQYMIEDKTCPIEVVRREVFKSISICNKLCKMYSEARGV